MTFIRDVVEPIANYPPMADMIIQPAGSMKMLKKNGRDGGRARRVQFNRIVSAT